MFSQILTAAGFNGIEFRDDSKLFLDYTKELLANLANNREFIEQKYDQKLFSTIQKQHGELLEKITQQQKFATRIVAQKIT